MKIEERKKYKTYISLCDGAVCIFIHNEQNEYPHNKLQKKSFN